MGKSKTISKIKYFYRIYLINLKPYAKLRALPRARRDAHKIPIAPLSGGGARKSPTTETGVDTKAASTK